jgi:hypothetical protein
MNLKGFHILFVTCSTLMCFLSAALYGSEWRQTGDNAVLLPASIWLVSGLLLIYYGNYFLKKFRDWGYL